MIINKMIINKQDEVSTEGGNVLIYLIWTEGENVLIYLVWMVWEIMEIMWDFDKKRYFHLLDTSCHARNLCGTPVRTAGGGGGGGGCMDARRRTQFFVIRRSFSRSTDSCEGTTNEQTNSSNSPHTQTPAKL